MTRQLDICLIRASLIVALSAALLVLGACGNDRLAELPDDAVLLAFGDSLTAGNGVSEAEAYPAILRSLTGMTVINAGISGEVTSEGLARLPDLLNQHSPDLVILLEGGNDILQNRSMSEAKANLARMIELSRNSGAAVVLIGVPRKSLFASTAEIYQELAEEYEVPLEGGIVGSLLKKPSMKSDAVHFNAAGYRALAEAVFELLEDAGAL